MTSQKGSARVIIIIALIVLLIGALGYIFWKNNINKDEAVKSPGGSSASEPSKSAAKLPDMIIYDPTVNVMKKDDVSGLKDAPDDFKQFIVSLLGKDGENTNAEAESNCFSIITVHKIYKQKYATGGVTAGGDCAGGAAVLWGIVDGSWKDIAGTQNIGFPCEDLERYKVPSEIAGSSCYDPKSPGGSRNYTQA